MVEIKNLKQYKQYDEKGVKVVEIVKDYVIVNNEFKCKLSNFSIQDSEVFIFGQKVSSKVAELFMQANKNNIA